LKIFYDKALNSGVSQDQDETLKRLIIEYVNKPISYYLPKNLLLWSGSMPSWANVITPHQLLVHSSGIQNYTQLPELKKPLVESFKDLPLDFDPGTRFSYCNSGYILLGEIIQHLSQQSLTTYMNTNLFNPLQMTSTFLPVEGEVSMFKKIDSHYSRLARGYEFDITVSEPLINEVKKYVPLEIAWAAGGMISNAPDLLRWNNALYAYNIIPKFLLDLMLNSYISIGNAGEFYAYGIERRTTNQQEIYYTHAGGIDGYKSNMVYIPNRNMSIICLSNIANRSDVLAQETKDILAGLPTHLTDIEKGQACDLIINNKYPAITNNKDLYYATLFATELLNFHESDTA
jgi:CubicO group peptidase (beta-lactamase class C family)